MRDFEIRRHSDGQIALWTATEELIDGILVPDNGQEPVIIVATARMDSSGEKFYVKMPVTRLSLEQEFDVMEARLRAFAEHWERSHL